MARILIVEDDRLAAAALAHLLKGLGHEVRRAHGFGEALTVGAGVELLISDLALPDGRGEDLPAQLGVPAIAMSGYDAPADHIRVRAAGFARLLGKPVDLDELARTVTELLPSGAGPGA